MLHLEHGFAAYQDDIGYVKDYPMVIRAKEGRQIAQRPIQYDQE